MTTQNIYDQRDKAFSNVGAYVIMHGAIQQGIINIKYPASGEGRLTAYVHLFGSRMVKASCSGANYDKVGTALYKIALEQLKNDEVTDEKHKSFYEALKNCNSGFDRHATYGQYTLLQAV